MILFPIKNYLPVLDSELFCPPMAMFEEGMMDSEKHRFVYDKFWRVPANNF